MSSLGSPNPFFIAGKKAYEVERSLRFDRSGGSNSYLNRTHSASNRTTWTWSAWIKRVKSNEEELLFGAFTPSSNGNSNYNVIQFRDDTFRLGVWTANLRVTTQLFRDFSSWYHFVVVFDSTNSTADDRARIYVNGSRITSFSTNTTISQNQEYAINSNMDHRVGGRTTSGGENQNANCYMAEVNFLDGYAYDPSYFGETDAITGQWNPKKYTGSYGTNGFYLNFSDNSGTTATTLGKDSSGNGNNFTPNNFSVSAGAGNDSLEDSPTNNFATINPLAAYLTNFEVPSNGNLDFSLAQHEFAMSSFEIPSSGKWYAEVLFTTAASGRIGISNPNRMNEGTGGTQKFNGIDNLGGTIVVDGSTVQTGNLARGDGDITGILVDRDAGTVSFTVNGSASGTAVNISSMNDSSQLVFRVGRNTSSGSAPTGSINFGQRPFSYLPTGYKSLCSANLPDPTIKLPNQHFNIVLYTGNNNTSQNITGVGFSPDWVWVKNRDNVERHHLVDSVRGDNKVLMSNVTDAERTGSHGGGHTQLNLASDGFNLVSNGTNDELNFGSRTYVAWNWNAGGSTVTNNDGSIESQVRANTTAGFSIVTYTGNGSNSSSVGHGLGVTPDAVLIKRRDGAGSWIFESPHTYNGKGMYLNFNNGSNSSGADTTSRSSTLVTFDNSSDTNRRVNISGETYVMYCFSSVASYSKIGSYVGNGNNNGTFVFTGFKVKFLLIKKTNTSESWILADTKRNSNVGRESPADSYILADSNNAESTGIIYDMLSNGFKFRSNSQNTSGHTYLYYAIGEAPFKNARAR